MAREGADRESLINSVVVLLAGVLVMAFLARRVLWFYVIFEASLLPTLFLIMNWGVQPERLNAGFYLILYTVVARMPILVSVLRL